MATHEFFQKQIIRLSNVFGKSKFPGERVELIWPEVKFLENMDLKSLVDGFVGDSKFAPTRQDFREAVNTRFGKMNHFKGDDMVDKTFQEQLKIEAASCQKLMNRSLEKFGEIALREYLKNYAKAFMPINYFQVGNNIYDKRALFHLAHNKGDMALSIQEASQGIFKPEETL